MIETIADSRPRHHRSASRSRHGSTKSNESPSDASGCCVGIISQADVASIARAGQLGELVPEVSRDAISD
jgi:hypothetical protein